MTLSALICRNDYDGDGSAETYAYSFKIFDQAHLLVTVRKASTGVETPLIISTDYTVTGVLETSGGNVVLVDGDQAWLDAQGDLDTGWHLTIRRVMPLTQLLDVVNAGGFYPSSLEAQYDKLVMQVQQLQDQMDRCVKFPETIDDSVVNPKLPGLVTASYYLKINATANGLTLSAT